MMFKRGTYTELLQSFFILGNLAFLGTGCSIRLIFDASSVAAVAPPAAFAIVSSSEGNGSVTLTWEASEGATSYTVQYGTSSGSYGSTFSTSATSPFTVSGLTNETPYYFMVTAVNSGGSTHATAEISDTPLYCSSYPAPANHLSMGSGTLADPHTLCAASQLASLSASSADWAKHFKVMQDIDLTGYTETADGTQWIPIGTSATPFQGSFDGNNKMISNLSYTNAAMDYVGLFGMVSGSRTVIKNVKARGFNIRGKDYVGGIAGSALYSSFINSSVTGTIQGGSYVGGLIGYIGAAGIILSSYSTATVGPICGTFCGGLIGITYAGTQVYHSFASGNVTGSYGAGGLIGRIYHSRVMNSYSEGDVASDSYYTAGFVGYADSSYIANCFSKGNVTGIINGSDEVGAFVSTASSGTGANNYYNSSAAIVNTGTGNAVYTGSATGVALGATPTYFQTVTNAPLSSWDFTNSWASRTADEPIPAPIFLDESSWGTCATHAADAPFAGGIGTPENPYLICTAAQLNAIGSNASYLAKSYKLMASIDLTGYTQANYNRIGTDVTAFTGIFNGNGKVISNLVYNSPPTNYVGILGHTSNALVQNLGATGIHVNGTNYTAALVGNLHYSALISSYATDSSVTSQHQMTGGLVGQGSLISQSYAVVTVTSASNGAGGLIGYSSSGGTQNFVVADVTAGGGTNGAVVGLEATVGAITQSYFDNTRACVNCISTTGTGVNAVTSPTYFYDKTNPPLNTWDFNNTWQENGSSYPTLR